MPEQTLNNKIGNCIGEHKRDLYDQLKAGAPITVAVEQFIFNLSFALRRIVENLNSETVED